MRKVIKYLVIRYLYFITRVTLIRAKPIIIAVTGTSNKTLVKQTIAEALSANVSVQTNQRQWNAEIGVPLALLSLSLKQYSLGGWLTLLMRVLVQPFILRMPSFFVVEIGFNQPGDMRYMAKLLQPRAIVITNIKPMHMENFNDDMKWLTDEFIALTKRSTKNDYIIVEHTLSAIPLIQKKTKASLITYSLDASKNDGWHIASSTEKDGKQHFTLRHNEYTQNISSSIPGLAVRQAHMTAQIVKDIFIKQ